MVRCEEFYNHFAKKGNFCGKSDAVVRQIEEYIEYVRRHKLKDFGGYRISNGALDPLISIEHIKSGIVHYKALRELKRIIRKEKLCPERITRRVIIELINNANNYVGIEHKLESIPGIRSRMGEYEHDIGSVGFDAKNMFDALKNDLCIKSNNDALKTMLEVCIRNPEEVRRIKEELDKKKETENNISVVQTA